MNAMTATAKGASTRELIVDRAFSIAASAGLEGLSIGPLAAAVNMSKSGVFAHFGSREDLQLAVLEEAARRFVDEVLLPALKQRRGIPRLRAIMSAWFGRGRISDGSCILLAAVSEFDDRPGPIRDRVVSHQARWRSEVARAVSLAIDTGELSAFTDAEQVAFELFALALGVNHDAGLFGYAQAIERGERGVERLLRSYAPAA